MSNDMFSELADSIGKSEGGFVHQNLCLKINGTQRGVYSTKCIRKGEMLISLPEKLSISGFGKPSCYDGRNVSDWLRCVASYYECHAEAKFQPYTNSLPKKYESLLEWSDEEVQSFLSGTTILNLVQEDRKNKVLEKRFRDAVKPYLKHLKLVSSSFMSMTEELEFFKKACMCISTRGFHLDTNLNDEKSFPSPKYNGPFLLPFIDLLNHDQQKKCTTLQFDASSRCFCMFAERDIASNEEIFHSYGSRLTSAQVLKTFGFVPSSSIDEVLEPNIKDMYFSPAVISQNELVLACRTLADSCFSSSLIEFMEANNSYEDERWKLDFDFSKRDLSFLPHDFLVPFQNPLSDEFITGCAVILMPSDVYEEFVKDGATVVDKSILEDYFLGKLVCQLILYVVSLKLRAFKPINFEGMSLRNIRDKDDETYLEELRSRPQQGCERAMYGLAVRIEEKLCLQKLRDEALSISEKLGRFPLEIERSPAQAAMNQGSSKKAKTN